MKKLFALLLSIPFLVLACAEGETPKTPSGDQAIALVTTLVKDGPALVDSLKATAEAAKGLGSADFAEALAFARRGIGVVSSTADFGLKLCASLPDEPPYSEACGELPKVKAYAETALAALSVLGAE